MPATRDVVPKVKSANHGYRGRGLEGCESDTSSEVDCGKSRQLELRKSRVVACAYFWKLGRESPNAPQDEVHETREVASVYYITGSSVWRPIGCLLTTRGQ